MSSLQLFPEVLDVSNLAAKFSQPYYMQIGVEGQAAASCAANVGQVYAISRPSDATSLFGASSPLTLLLNFMLARGIAPILAVASVKSASAPTLIQRQAAWSNLESHPAVRIRLSDDVAQATLVALAVSAQNAALIYNKQVSFGGMAAGSTKSALLTAATAIQSSRFVLVGPGVYDINNNLLSGNYASAAVACEVSKNPDISDSLNLELIPNLAAIELGATGAPLFSERIVSGAPVNDFEDLLQGGVSPLETDRSGSGVRITHLRTTFTGAGSDTTYDALMTRLIEDQLFIDVREYAYNNNFLRKGNTPANLAALQAGVEALLASRPTWVQGLTQPDGTQGFNVSVTSSPDQRQVIIGYEGGVVRGIDTIAVDAQLSITV